MFDDAEEIVTHHLKTNTFNDEARSLFGAWSKTNEHTNFIVNVDTTSAQFVRNVWPTSDVYQSLSQAVERAEAELRQKHDSDIELLNNVIDWQAQTLEYNALQQALQFGAIEEADFELEVEKFVRDEKDIDESNMVNSISRLQAILRNPLSFDDYANFLSVNIEDLNKCQMIVNVISPKLGS